MMSQLKMAVLGAGAAGAAGVAVVTQNFPETDEAGLAENPPWEICLKGDFVMFEGVGAGCYSHDQLRQMEKAALVDSQGKRVSVSMAHPSDMSVAPAEIATCHQYDEARFDGWYALSSRDMRREAYFVRACGALAMLSEAQQPETTFFEAGSPRAEEVEQLAAGIKFGELTSGQAITAEKGETYVWRVRAGDLSLSVHELANADFDNDGIEEIFAFLRGGPEAGTAAYYEAGLLEKDAAGAGLSFTPFDVAAGEAGRAGG